jgi:pimeloyl-ACP methyl ester carboxylesterase
VGAAGLVMPTPSPLQRQLDAGVNPFVITSLEQHEAFLRFVLEVPPPMPWAIRTYLAEAFMARASMNGKVMTDLLRDEIDLTQRLPSIQAPTLVLWGDCDRLIDLSAGRVFHQRIPDATLIILHGVGHCPQYEAPDRTAQLLSRFLADQGGGAIVPDINP